MTAILPHRRPTHSQFAYPRPVVLDPAVDRRLVAFGGATRGPLDRPAQPVAQQRPHPGWMMVDPVRRWITVAIWSRVHSSPVNPWAVAPSRRACSTWASWVSESRRAGPLGPLLRSASAPPCSQRAYQMLTAWVETASWRATSAWRTPAANSSVARSRRAWSRSRSCCAAGRQGTVGMPGSSPWPAVELQLDSPSHPSTRHPSPF
jgi:hypothetical protein